MGTTKGYDRCLSQGCSNDAEDDGLCLWHALQRAKASLAKRTTMHRIRKSFTFEAAHQLEDAYTAACHQCIHGHSYKVEVYLTCTLLDKDGMVVDFSRLRDFKERVMSMWDHGLILHENKRPHLEPLIRAGVLKAEKVSFLQDNPTAETMAHLLAMKLISEWLPWLPDAPHLNRGLRVERVRVHETSTGWAEWQDS